MKHLIIATLIVLFSSRTVSSLRLPGAIIPQLSATGKIADLTHHLAKRQTVDSFDTLRDVLDCAATQTEYECSSGLAQQVADAALACGIDLIARSLANQCARNENGDFCGVAFFRHFLDQQIVEGAIACLLMGDSESCSLNCRSFLESTRSKLGCCINTDTIGSLLDIFVNESAWSVCNVSLPAGVCRDGVSLNPPQDVQTACTVRELIRFTNQICAPSVGQPLVDALLENSKCQRYARQYVDICRRNANNQRCDAIVGTNVINTNFDGSSSSPLALIENSCNSSLSSESCSPPCQRAITGIANSFDCCVNIFNNSDSDMQSVNLLSYSLWNKCGVESPGFCTAASTLELSGAATMKALAWMIAVAIAIHMVLHI